MEDGEVVDRATDDRSPTSAEAIPVPEHFEEE